MPRIVWDTEEDRLRHLLSEARAVAVGEYERAQAEKNRAERYRRALEKVTADALMIVEGSADAEEVARGIVERGKGALPWGGPMDVEVRESVTAHPVDEPL